MSVLFPLWRRHLLPTSAFLNLLQFSAKTGALWGFPCKLAHLLLLSSLFRTCLGSHVDGYSSSGISRKQSHSKCPVSLAFTTFPPPLQCFLSLRCKSRTTEVSVVGGYHIGPLFLAFWLVMFFCNGLHLQPPSLRLLDTSDSILTVSNSPLLHTSLGWVQGLVSCYLYNLARSCELSSSLTLDSQALLAWYLWTVASYLSS